MGLLDPLFPQDSPIGGLLSDPNAALALAATLMQGRRDQSTLGTLGQGLLTAASMHAQNVKEERANRQNELQQVSGAYKMAKDLDAQQAWADMIAGRPHATNPVIAQLEARLGELSGLPAMTRTPTGFPTQPQMPSPRAAPQAVPGMAPASRSPMANPDYQPPVQAVQQRSIANAQQVAQPQVVGQDIPFPRLLELAGIQPSVAAGYIQANKPEKLMDAINEAFKIRGSGGNFVRLNPRTGQMEFLGGQVQPNSFPVISTPTGLVAQPVQGLNEAIAAQTEAKTNAEEATRARYAIETRKNPQGQNVDYTRSQLLGLTGSTPQSPQMQVPPQVQAQRDQTRLQILLAERDNLARQGQTDPALEKEIQFAQQGVNFAGQKQPGFVSGPTIAQQTAAETNPKLQLDYLAKSYEEANKAADSLIFTDAARRAVNGSTSTGIFAKPALLTARVGAAFGITDPRAVSDPEVFMSMAARNTMSVIKSLGSGSGISDADREYAAKAVGGEIRLNRDSINRLLDITERAQRRLVELHNSRVDQADSNGVPSVYSYRVNPPETARTPVAGGPLQQNATALFKARQAIQQGKSREAVIQRMIEQGFDPAGL